MSKAQELEVLKNDIRVQGCTFSPIGLHLQEVNEETLLHAGAFLAQVETSRSWWFGDYLLAYCAFCVAQESDYTQAEAKRDPKLRNRLYRRYTAERAEIAPVTLQTLHEWREVCDFYEMPRRRGELSNQHHLESMWAAESGDKAVADEWLARAIENKWTVPQLRKAIRQAKQADTEPTEPMPEVTQTELFACARWSRTVIKRVPDMDLHEVEQLLADLAPIVALSSQLANRLAEAKRAA